MWLSFGTEIKGIKIMGDNTQYHIVIFKKSIPGCGRTDEVKEISKCKIARSKIGVSCKNCLDFQQKEGNIESNYLEDGMGRKIRYIKVV